MNRISIPNLILIALTTIFSIASDAPGATITVTNTSDNGPGSLRQAILDASAGDTVVFGIPAADPNCVSGTCVVALSSGELSIDKHLTIIGPGARALEIRQINSNAFVFQVFNFNQMISVRLSGFTVTGGFVGIGFGSPSGTIDLNGVCVRNNIIGLYHISGTMQVTQTLVANNVNPESNTFPPVGGIFNTGNMAITNSTISDNSGAMVGGILNYGESLSLINVTISSNSTQSGGMGGGIGNFIGTLALRNTIVAGNTADSGADIFNAGAAVTTYGNNLIGNNDSVALEFPAGSANVNGDHVGVSALLGALQNNGGQTDSRTLLAGSVAIDNGNNCVTDLSCASGNPPFALTTDQRGAVFQRLSGSSVDIGAYEIQVSAPTITPAEMIQNLILAIRAFDPPIPRGIDTALISKLKDALAKLETGDTEGARSCLLSFINQVRAQTGKSIDPERAVILTAAANDIIEALD